MDSVEEIENALDIGFASSPDLAVEECRRLTGPGLLWDHPGAVVQVACRGFGADEIAKLWHTHARKVLDAINWPDEQITDRAFEGGINLAISAPMDQLYSAIFVAQTAWHFCAATLLSVPADNFDRMIAELQQVMQREANPNLIALLTTAQTRGIEVLCDDDEISIGHGIGSRTWPVAALPSPDGVDWDHLHNVPIALVTGTNGKTTTTRLCAAIVKAAGHIAGLTSTDFVRVGDDVLDRGDYSGPGGARLLLRDPRLEIACLEVARGGILRRGLPTRKAQVAVVTNVAADHLGQYGVNTVPELARAKFAVHRGLIKGGVLALNADDPFVRTESEATDANIWWFSLDPKSPQITQSIQSGQPCAWRDQDQLWFFDGAAPRAVANVRDIPITMDGAAGYNVLNALAAICVARAMGLNDTAIRAGLSAFKNNPKDNPGRFNEFAVNGARVFVDFAHNPHSVGAVAQTISAIPSKRRFVMLSHAGDRSDQDIRDLTLTALELRPDFVVAAELPDYLRGRELGEVTKLIVQTCLDQGLSRNQIVLANSPSDGTEKMVQMLDSGDTALLLVLSERDRVFSILEQNA
jgi:cyanophycin synthetase